MIYRKELRTAVEAVLMIGEARDGGEITGEQFNALMDDLSRYTTELIVMSDSPTEAMGILCHYCEIARLAAPRVGTAGSA